MVLRTSAPPVRWLLIVALAIGLVGMHHLLGAAHSPSGHHATTHAGQHAQHAPNAAHGCCGGELAMGHMCQAVLPSEDLPQLATAVLGALSVAAPTLALPSAPTTHPPRGPPSGAVLLLRLCVSRR
ncbi:hypothetical protein BKA01_004160 [Pseudonocardia eucalypti]|uniref:DUF6153 family protein n=1 Tax=Pseudonocardia eucalypti TaxID=648755 RepID=UPI00161C04E2|nr:hypothetical protein [Pseudonocardia eucalypti]